jgi:SAM-dependent methyltransferase
MEKKVHPGYTEANRLAWNEAMPRHQIVRKEYWDQQFSTPGYVVQKDPELSLLSSLPVAGKDIIQLCCNNGVELLSLKNMGASRCLGVDISDLAIAEASERAELCHIDVEYMCADVFQLPSSLERQFDLVYITVGALTWLHDLEALFQKSYALLRPRACFLFMNSIP